MSVPWDVKITRHEGDLDDDGHDAIENLVTVETDTALVFAPNGTGGVEARAETGGGGAGTGNVYTVEPQAPHSRHYLMRDGTWRDPLTSGLGTLTAGTIATITDDTKYNAWPQVVRLHDGSLLMAYVKGDTHNLDNTGNIVGKIGAEALDGTVTWGSEFTIANETLAAINVSLGVLDTGRIVAAYNLYNYPTTPVDAVRVRYSDDLGATWSAAYTVDSTFTGTVSSSTARIVQRRDGAVLLTVYGKNTGATYYTARLFISTDDGETWGTETTIANGPSDSRQYYEPSLTVLDNGTLLCLIRNEDAGNMYQTSSTDGGATWSAPAVAFGGYSPANAIQLSSGTLISPIRGNAAAKLEAFTSIDRGATWTSRGILDSTSYTELEYACPVELLDGRGFLVVYSVQPSASTSNADIKTVTVIEATTVLASGAPTTADYLVGTANGSLSGEIVVGTTPGGELGGTWASPTVDSSHAGGTHAATQAAAEATAAAALAAHVALTGSGGGDHVHVVDETFSGDASTTVFYLANEAVPDSVMGWVAGVRTPVTLGGTLNDEVTFGVAPGSGTLNVSIDYAAVLS